MKKKIILLVGIAVLLGSLFINLIIGEHSGKTDLTFYNIEALAEKETPDGDIKPTCVESGYICFGVDKEGTIGNHPGLVPAQN